MNISVGIDIDLPSDSVWLVITDGELLASFELVNPRRTADGRFADMVINGELITIALLPGLHLGLPASPRKLLERHGHRMQIGAES